MLTLSDQSHVSASPSRSRGWSDRQAASQQQQRLGQAETTADSAAQSSYGTGLSQGCSGSELGTKQPVLHGLTGQAEGAEAAAVACGQGLPGAALATAEPQKRGAGEGLTRAGALPAALEPAGPVAGTQSGGTVPFASVDKAQQSWQQQPKHKTHVSQGRVQKTKRKSTAPLPGDQAPERRPKLATAAVRVAEQKSRNVSHEASAVPAESQQSAVHAEHSASTHRHKHAQRAARTSKDSMGDAAGERSHCDGRRSSSRAKQARAEAAVCCAYVKDVGQSRMHGGNHLNSMPAVSPINQWGGQTRGTGRIGMYQSNACESVDRAERLHEGAADDHTHVGRAPHIQHTPEGSSGMGSESISHGRAGQAAKRSSRNRDGEANKPWWVV